jgi:metabolite-proton symporter
MTEITAKTDNRSRLRVILAASIGSALEWYDFFLYGTAAALVFGELFFPKSDPVVGTLLAFLTFGVGFVVRPLGGILFGIMGDRFGRKPVLVATLLMIGIGTTLIGVLPTYAQIGYWAPALLVAMRVVQGLGAGAEYGGAVIFLVENAPPKHRGFWGGFAPLGVSIGNLLAAGAFALVTLLPREDLMSWGWRIPFLASFLLIVVGIYVRLKITETPVFTEAVLARGKVERNPAMEALKRHPRNFFVVLGARLAENGLGYLFPVFGLSYVITTLGVPKSEALSALMLAFVVELFAILGFAALSDRIGRRPVYMFGALAGIAWAFPFFWLVGTKEWIWIAVAFIGARAVVTAAMFGPQAAYFAELFPPQRRFAGFAFARELGSLLAGGPAPFLAAALVAWSGSWWPVACYAAFLAACTAFAIWCGPETFEESITVDNTTDGVAMQAAAMPQHAA